ncbi:MAG: hypothetical protein ACP5MG_02250 [Verrucomicrobiia bacterium]
MRLLSPLQPMFAASACGPGKDTFARHLRLYHLAPGQPPLLAARLPGATGLAPLTSQVAFSSQACGSAFRNRWHWKEVSVLPDRGSFPVKRLVLSCFSTGSIGSNFYRQNTSNRAGSQ